MQNDYMIIKLVLSDSVYNDLIASGKRIQGSIGLVSPTQGTFNAHRRTKSRCTRFIKLAHGRASITDDSVRLSLNVSRRESDVVPYEVIDRESLEDSDFVYANS